MSEDGDVVAEKFDDLSSAVIADQLVCFDVGRHFGFEFGKKILFSKRRLKMTIFKNEIFEIMISLTRSFASRIFLFSLYFEAKKLNPCGESDQLNVRLKITKNG